MPASKIFDSQRPGMRTILGPLIDLSHAGDGREYSVMRTIAPAGTVVPLHSHAERETMVIVEGTLTAWLDGSWKPHGPGDLIEIAPNAPHALRNDGPDEVAMVLVTTPRMAQFFAELSASQADAEITPERLAQFGAIAEAYGFWNAGPAEQAAIGVTLPGADPDA